MRSENLRYEAPKEFTPTKTPRLSGLKSQVLKPTFLLKNDDEKWPRIFLF